ncbi:MAG: porin family protein [Chryseolinea sp.]
MKPEIGAETQNDPMLLAKKFLVIGCLFALSSQCYGQKFSFGAKAGPLVTWANFSDKDDKHDFANKPKLGYYAAALVIFPLKNDYSFQTEFGFSQRGRRVLFNENTWENNATYYFADGRMMLRRSFPLRLGPNIPSKWFVNVGPHISYWIGGHGTIDAGGSYKYDIVFSEMPTEPSGPDFNKMYISDVNQYLFGIDIGAGFIAPLRSNTNLLVELRFTSGHTFFGNRSSASNRTLGFMDNLRSNEKMINLTIAYIWGADIQKSKKGKSTKDRLGL